MRGTADRAQTVVGGGVVWRRFEPCRGHSRGTQNIPPVDRLPKAVSLAIGQSVCRRTAWACRELGLHRVRTRAGWVAAGLVGARRATGQFCRLGSLGAGLPLCPPRMVTAPGSYGPALPTWHAVVLCGPGHDVEEPKIRASSLPRHGSQRVRAGSRAALGPAHGPLGRSRSDDRLQTDLRAAQRAGRALQRDEEPHDLVGVVAFLALKDSDFVTGQTSTSTAGTHVLTAQTTAEYATCQTVREECAGSAVARRLFSLRRVESR
jgi:hypothetical protein